MSAFKGGSNALAAMLKARTDNGMVVINEENAAKLPVDARPVGLTKQVSINTQPTKCVACAKSVFKMEEIIAMGHSWHGTCFTCGGTNDDGCKRKLARDNYLEKNGQPYCKACFEKNKAKKAEEFKEEVEKISRPLSALFIRKQQQQKVEGQENSQIEAMNDFLQPAQFGRGASAIIRPLPAVPGGSAPQIPKCPSCSKSVYKMEEIIAIGQSWHSTCFCCGGTNSDGCKRKLVRDNYTEKDGMPYCKACYDKLFRGWVKASKAAANDNLSAMLANKRSSAKLLAGSIVTGNNNVTVPESSDANNEVLNKVLASNAAAAPLYEKATTEAPVWNANVSATRAKYAVGKTTPFNPANKCVKCSKTVYKMEETIAVGQVWHNQCFCCGGLNSDGCNKVLSRDNYVDHDGQPYCNSCFNKQFRTKGFGVAAGLNTDYGEKK